MIEIKSELGLMSKLVADYKASAERLAEFAKRHTGFDNLDGAGKFADSPPGRGKGQLQIFYPAIYALGGVSSCGKTTFTLQLLYQLAELGVPSLFVSYEMSPLALLIKLVAHILYRKQPADKKVNALSSSDILREGRGNDYVKATLEEIAAEIKLLRIVGGAGWEVGELDKELRNFCAGCEIAPVIAIDYLQLVPDNRFKEAKPRIDNMLVDLRKLQTETNATLILLSAFNRSSELRDGATLSSFKESGAIEYTADVVWALEPARKNDDEAASAADKRMRKETIRGMQLRCLKNREGALYDAYFHYHAANDTFEACTEFEVLQAPEESKPLELD